MKYWVVLLLFYVHFTSSRVRLDVDWRQFLQRADPVWKWTLGDKEPAHWYQAPFIGNGNIGAYFMIIDSTSIWMEVSRTDVYDDRPEGSKYSLNNFVCDQPRLPIG
jgi:hypothetical protein